MEMSNFYCHPGRAGGSLADARIIDLLVLLDPKFA